MNVTKKQLENALTEWDRLWRENPEEFERIEVSLLQGTPETYGAGAVEFLLYILNEQKKSDNVGLDKWKSQA